MASKAAIVGVAIIVIIGTVVGILLLQQRGGAIACAESVKFR